MPFFYSNGLPVSLRNEMPENDLGWPSREALLPAFTSPHYSKEEWDSPARIVLGNFFNTRLKGPYHLINHGYFKTTFELVVLHPEDRILCDKMLRGMDGWKENSPDPFKQNIAILNQRLKSGFRFDNPMMQEFMKAAAEAAKKTGTMGCVQAEMLMYHVWSERKPTGLTPG